jgi:nitronate monooxygenase
LVFHDVSQVRHARRAAAAGVDGLVLVCAGSGGHTGHLSPFAFIGEVREFFDGAVALAGAIRSGAQVVAARALGADFAYCGSGFIASEEAWAAPLYKEMVATSGADDIVVSNAVTGLRGSYLKKSFERLGLDPEQLRHRETSSFDLALTPEGTKAKAWKDIWSAGQGVGGTMSVRPAAQIIEQFATEYEQALQQLRATL